VTVFRVTFNLNFAVEAESACRFDRLKAPSPSTPLGTLSLSNGHVEGLALAATRSRSLNGGISALIQCLRWGVIAG
jgi:hypothetical protein